MRLLARVSSRKISLHARLTAVIDNRPAARRDSAKQRASMRAAIACKRLAAATHTRKMLPEQSGDRELAHNTGTP